MDFSVVAIEREYASGGREIGERVAKKLGVPCYGSEVLQLAASQLGIAPEYVAHSDEKAPGSLLYSLSALGRPISFASDRLSENALQRAEADVIRRLGDQAPCVIIGRCAGAVLRERRHTLRVFVYASAEKRRQRAAEVYGVDPREVDGILRRHDRARANYYSFYSSQRWDDRAGYHLMLDSGRLGMGRCADIVACAARGGEA